MTSYTLVFQPEDTVRLFRTLLLLEPLHFAKSVLCLIIESVYQVGVLLGTSFFTKLRDKFGEPCCLFHTLCVIGTREYLNTQTGNIWTTLT